MEWNALYFALGCSGSGIIEVITLLQYYETGTPFPPRYRSVGFWCLRVLVALAAGALVLAYEIRNNPILALNVGASAPTIFLTLGKGVKLASSQPSGDSAED